jgi:uncharacterized membrane protein
MSPEGEETPSVKLGLIVTPEIDPGAAEQLRDGLAASLASRYPDSRWQVEVVEDPLAHPPVHLTALVEAAREGLLARGWDLAIVITDLPLRHSRRPLLSHVSRTHGVAVVSLPALGVLQRRRRLETALIDAIAALLGDLPAGGDRPSTAHRGVRRRLGELAARVDEDAEAEGVVFLARVLGGNARLLAGMVGSNHPWRLASRLGRAMLGALAAAVFGLVTSDLWRIAASLEPARLLLAGLASIAAATATLIAVHGLWERRAEPRVREQVALFNIATLVTVALGVGALYLAVFVVSLAGAVLLIESSLFAKAIGHGVDAWDYLRLAWLASSLGTIGGALGATVETDEAVREAAYAFRPERERSHVVEG